MLVLKLYYILGSALTPLITEVAMEVGQKIYYTGDMANNSGWFTLVQIAEPTTYGQAIKLVENEGQYSENRTINLPGVHHVGDTYHGHCNPRFVTEEAYRAFHAARGQSLTF